jgi:hypothetical protein
MFRCSVKSTGYSLYSPVFPSLPFPYVTVCHHISTYCVSEDRPARNVRVPSHFNLLRFRGSSYRKRPCAITFQLTAFPRIFLPETSVCHHISTYCVSEDRPSRNVRELLTSQKRSHGTENGNKASEIPESYNRHD